MSYRSAHGAALVQREPRGFEVVFVGFGPSCWILIGSHVGGWLGCLSTNVSIMSMADMP